MIKRFIIVLVGILLLAIAFYSFKLASDYHIPKGIALRDIMHIVKWGDTLSGISSLFFPPKITRSTRTKKYHKSHSDFICPLRETSITSPYGIRRHPIHGWKSFHHGIDLYAERGTPVYAARSGRVIFGRSK